MSKEQESLKTEIYGLLKSRGLNPISKESSGDTVPIPEEADVFEFMFSKDGKDYGKVWVTLDGLRQLIVYFGKDVADSPKNGSEDSNSWSQLHRALSRFATSRQLSFELSDQSNLEADMAKREHTKREEQVNEGYYPISKTASGNNNIPSVTMRIQHTRTIEEGEQRYRNIARIFVENQDGERILLPTTKPGLARTYVRHIAEGGKPNDERWNHLNNLCEEYQKMAGFVRATRNGQFNESAQSLVNEGINHYQKLRETLGKLQGKRGYNAYFESYTPALMEDEEQVDLSEMFMSSSLDPRIESVMPILSKLSKNITETTDMAETIALEEWADSLTELSNEKLGDYKKAAGADASAADKAGDFKRGDKRFKGIVRATVKQGDNDTKKHQEQGVAEGQGVDQRKLDIIKRMHGILSKNKEQNIGEADVTTPNRDEWNGISPADMRGQTQYHQRGDQLNNMYGDFQKTAPARQSDVNKGDATVSDYSMAVKPLPLTRQQKLNTTYGDFTNSFPAKQSDVDAGDVDVSDYSLSRGVPTPKLAGIKEAGDDPFADDSFFTSKSQPEPVVRAQQKTTLDQGKGTSLKDMNPIDRDQYLKNTNRTWDEKTQRSAPITQQGANEDDNGIARLREIAGAQTHLVPNRNDIRGSELDDVGVRTHPVSDPGDIEVGPIPLSPLGRGQVNPHSPVTNVDVTRNSQSPLKVDVRGYGPEPDEFGRQHNGSHESDIEMEEGSIEKTPTGLKHHGDFPDYPREKGKEFNHNIDRLNKSATGKLDRAFGVNWNKGPNREVTGDPTGVAEADDFGIGPGGPRQPAGPIGTGPESIPNTGAPDVKNYKAPLTDLYGWTPGSKSGGWDAAGQQKYIDRTSPGVINNIKDKLGYDMPDPEHGPRPDETQRLAKLYPKSTNENAELSRIKKLSGM